MGAIGRINLFGRFAVVRKGEAVKFTTHPTESLVALLALHAGRAVPRPKVVASIWPDVDQGQSLNRLRTVLVYARQSLGDWPVLVADRHSLAVEPSEVEIDLERAERLYRKARVVQEQDEERAALMGMLEIIGRDLLADWEDEWVEPFRNQWIQRRSQARLRLARMALDAGEFEAACHQAENVIAEQPFNEEGWASYMRAMAALGREAQAVERFRDQRRRVSEVGFSAELVDLVRRVGAGQIRESEKHVRTTAAERDLLAKTMEAHLAANPESVLPILAGESFRGLAFQHPLEAWGVLRMAIERTEGTDTPRLKAMLNAMVLADMVDEYGVAFDFGEWLIENVPDNMQEHRYALNYLGFISFEIRDWDAAQAYLEKFLSLSQKSNSGWDISLAQAQLASVGWHQGRVDEAERQYLSHLADTEHDDSPRGRFNQCVFLANLGGISLTKLDWKTATERLSRAYAAAVANKIDYVRSACLPTLGFAKAATGHVIEGSRLLAEGFTQSHRSRYRRLNQIAADYVAGGLALRGYPAEARALLEAYTEQRHEARHERSVAEELYVAWVNEQLADSEPNPTWLKMRKAELIVAAAELLEQPV